MNPKTIKEIMLRLNQSEESKQRTNRRNTRSKQGLGWAGQTVENHLFMLNIKIAQPIEIKELNANFCT
jgi:hypothetical protein